MGKLTDFPILKSSPIVEATFQVNFAVKQALTSALACSFVQEQLPGFKYREDIFAESISVKRKNAKALPGGITHNQIWTGVRFIRENHVITIFPNGFAYGILKPYPADESFFKNISEIAETIGAQFSGMATTRVGLRFINRFEITADRTPAKVLTKIPISPKNTGYGDSASFLYQDLFVNKETGIGVVVNRVFPANDPATPYEQKVILDIDASLVPNRVLKSADFEKIVDELRFAVNKTFFGSVQKDVIKELS